MTARRRIQPIIHETNYHPDRYRFNTLPELDHLFLNISRFGNSEQEKLCHCFAGAMLFDKRAIEQELGLKRKQISLKELTSLKNSTEFRFRLLRKGISPFPKQELEKAQ